MVVVDWYPNKDGYVDDGHVVAFCYAEDVTMAAGAFVRFGATTRSNYVSVRVSDDCCDAVGMCLRTPVAIGDVVPVAFMGVVKTAVYSTIGIGDLVGNASTLVSAIVECPDSYGAILLRHNGNAGNFTARIVGTALQGGGVADEILVLLGKLC